jgi:RNase adaptor protein for sRNA GlmZ degradation
VLFLAASDETLVRRYQETGRRHPLEREGSLLDSIRAERKAMANVRDIARRVVDTSALTVSAHGEMDVVGVTTMLRAAMARRHAHGPRMRRGGEPRVVVN